jgi:hypothetical protein
MTASTQLISGSSASAVDQIHVVSAKNRRTIVGAAKKTKKITQPSVVWTLFQCFYGTLLPAACMKMTTDSLQFVGPQILK